MSGSLSLLGFLDIIKKLRIYIYIYILGSLTGKNDINMKLLERRADKNVFFGDLKKFKINKPKYMKRKSVQTISDSWKGITL